MSAIKTDSGKWIEEIKPGRAIFNPQSDGVHIVRISETGSRIIESAEIVVSWQDLLCYAEKQLVLFPLPPIKYEYSSTKEEAI
jgi:hypothetical protein